MPGEIFYPVKTGFSINKFPFRTTFKNELYLPKVWESSPGARNTEQSQFDGYIKTSAKGVWKVYFNAQISTWSGNAMNILIDFSENSPIGSPVPELVIKTNLRSGYGTWQSVYGSYVRQMATLTSVYPRICVLGSFQEQIALGPINFGMTLLKRLQ